ncbi:MULTISPECIES: alcohol dehydrogenase catalytic domain-containing protein [unclassified Corynebacterium]|uniref:alcohol dehydrogenase catalytic domain-containing protein n=1 Tax=unclassified Corynebacterium TaxID=2624378 RepID=UPI000B02940C|nr:MULTISPECIES: alcohol dehydrogenase catalytic domain-containing protein [unclassified Corynebacterium]
MQEGETLVEITTATICGSDRHTVLGRRSAPCPSVLGHEGVGVVRATRNPDLQVGQRVVFSVTAPCMECDRCRKGMTAKCRKFKKTGHEAFDSDWPLSGTYASHIVLRNHQPVVVVPDLLPDVATSIATCAGATVMACMEQAGALTGKRVLVMGIGMLGLIAVEAAVRGGASEVVAVDRNQTRLEWARQLGAVVPAPSAAGADFELGSFDITLEFSGSEFGGATCINSLDIGGRAVLAGSVAASPTYALDPEWLVRGWRAIAGVHNYEPRHLEQTVEFIADSQIDWDTVVSEPIALEDVPVEVRATPGIFLRATLHQK